MVEPFIAIPLVPIDNVYSDRYDVSVVSFEGVSYAHAEVSFCFKRNRNCSGWFAAVFVAFHD